MPCWRRGQDVVMMDRMENTIFNRDRLKIKMMDREGIIFVYGQEEGRDYQDQIGNLKNCDKSLKSRILERKSHTVRFLELSGIFFLRRMKDSLQQE